MGHTASKKFDIPFIFGDTKQRLAQLQDNLQTVVSRVGDEGVSLPNIEQVIEISWLHGCYDRDTQVMTKNGWKWFEHVDGSDDIATLNKDGHLEYHKPLDIQRYYYNGQMIHFGGKQSSYDLLVTPDHNMYVRKRGSDFGFHMASNMLTSKTSTQSYELKKDCIWNGSDVEFFELPDVPPTEWMKNRLDLYHKAFQLRSEGKTTQKIAKELGLNYWAVSNWFKGSNPKNSQFRLVYKNKIPIKTFLQIFGWYISEGSIDHGRSVKITQLKNPNREEIFDLFKDAGFEPK
jgi:hypothetical protein